MRPLLVAHSVDLSVCLFGALQADFASAAAAASDATSSSGGVNCAEKLGDAMRMLTDDPYLALGITTGADASDSEVDRFGVWESSPIDC
jgi:hypothetical protein